MEKMDYSKEAIQARRNEQRDRWARDEETRRKTINDIAENLGQVMRRHLDECTRCCPNCTFWINGPMTAPIEHCELAGARPPAHIIAFGCERYQDKIPF